MAIMTSFLLFPLNQIPNRGSVWKGKGVMGIKFKTIHK